jgi:hypothetical protein
LEASNDGLELPFELRRPLREAAMAAATCSTGSSVLRNERILSRREIEGLIADGRTVIIVDGKVLKVDNWLKYHPGGDKAIMHMVGRDATDEVNAWVEAP